MKKLLLILIILFISLTIGSTPYSIKCYKCEKIGVRATADRSFKDEYPNREHKNCCIYHCQYGHILYVNNDGTRE